MGVGTSNNQGQSISKLTTKQKIEMIVTYMARMNDAKPFPYGIADIIVELIYHSRFDVTPRYRSNKDANDASKRYDLQIILYLAGNYDVGKTSLVKRWRNDLAPDQWNDNDLSIIMDQRFDKYLNYKDQRILLRVWDPSGRDDRYGATVHSSCHWVEPHILCYCYDVANNSSLTDLLTWQQKFRNRGIMMAYNALFKVLVGCKSDLDDNCSKDDIHKVMTELDIDKHLKVSSQDNINMDALFEGFVTSVVDYLRGREIYPFRD